MLDAPGERIAMAAQGPNEDADAAGIGSFQHCFASRRLLDVIIAEAAGLLGALIRQRTRAMRDPAERVAVYVRYVVQLAAEDPTWAWFVLRASDAVPRLAAGVTAPLESHFRAGIASGRFRVEDPAVAFHLVGDALLHVMRARLLGRVGPHADIVAAEHVLRILGLPPGVARTVARCRTLARSRSRCRRSPSPRRARAGVRRRDRRGARVG